MPVRWVGFCGIDASKRRSAFYCNRGTSGIDGCTSTALGAALKTKKPVILITGDMGFFYDRNAFWQQNIPANFKVIVLNNFGGGIFRLIKGPGEQEELEELFETRHHLNASGTAADFGLDYFSAQSKEELNEKLPGFMKKSDSAGIFEIFTQREANLDVLNRVKSLIKKQYEE
jgi:2-succinyl-5-enolpyruvyl-6-hydroxy-3-cyclohexene-1-carboxylate synthase